MTSLDRHLFGKGRKRILAIDGGGARGLLACGILRRVEALLASRVPIEARGNFRLHHYFDLIGGTSTGAIIAAGLSIGLSVDDVKKLYLSLCPKIFAPRNVKGIKKPRFDGAVLAAELNRILRERDGVALPFELDASSHRGTPIELGSNALHTGLALFAKRIDTGGVWSFTNNPRWAFYDERAGKTHGLPTGSFVDNKTLSLAALVRASAAAPTYFESVGLGIEKTDAGTSKIGPELPGIFVDGALSGRNTPALQMLLMATHPIFGFRWSTGEDNLLMTSVGTGWWRPKVNDATVGLRPWATQAKEALFAIECLQTMIHDSSLNAIALLQSLAADPGAGRRWKIDGEMGDMSGFTLTPEPLLRFRRLDVRLDSDSLRSSLGRTVEQEASAEEPSITVTNENRQAANAWGETPLVMRLRELAEADRGALRFLYHLGERYAERTVDGDDFPPWFDPPEMLNPADSETVKVLDAPHSTTRKPRDSHSTSARKPAT